MLRHCHDGGGLFDPQIVFKYSCAVCFFSDFGYWYIDNHIHFNSQCCRHVTNLRYDVVQFKYEYKQINLNVLAIVE